MMLVKPLKAKADTNKGTLRGRQGRLGAGHFRTCLDTTFGLFQRHFFFLKIHSSIHSFLFYLYGGLACMHVCAPGVCKPGREYQIPWNGSHAQLTASMWCWDLKLDPLNCEPSLQPSTGIFKRGDDFLFPQLTTVFSCASIENVTSTHTSSSVVKPILKC